MTGRRRTGARRAGFTLVEVLVTALVAGILASIALPKVNEALNRARAAAILSDLGTIRLAAFEVQLESGALPAEADWGVVPPAMQAYLPESFTFTRGRYQYRWRLMPPAYSPWGVPTGRLQMQLQSGDPRLLAALAAMSNPQTSIVTATQVQFWVLP